MSNADEDDDVGLFESGRRMFVVAKNLEQVNQHEFQSSDFGPAYVDETNMESRKTIPSLEAVSSVIQDEAVVYSVAETHSPPADKMIASSDVMPITLVTPADDDSELTADHYVAKAKEDGVSWGVSAVGANDSGRDGRDVTVAILDTGIQADHPAFAGLNPRQKDFTRFEIDPLSHAKRYPHDEAPDFSGHGTHCAGTVFGRDVEGVRIGVAKGVNDVMIGKVLGPKATTEDLVAGIEWAIEGGADIISMSLNFDLRRVFKYLVDKKKVDEVSAFWNVMNRHDAAMAVLNSLLPYFESKATVELGRASAPLIIAAAGNQSNRPEFTVSKLSPATATNIVAVGAIGQSGSDYAIARFSNGEPHFVAPGVGIVSAGTHFGALKSMNGTSMAAPHVTGVAALHWQKLAAERGADKVTATMVREQLIASAVQSLDSLGLSDNDFGTGMPRAPE